MTPDDTRRTELPETLLDALEAAVTAHPDHVALRGEGGRGLVFTYSQVLDKVKRLAAGLQNPEYADLKEIGLLAENRPEWPIAYLGIVASGKIVVPIDANLKPNEMESIIGHAGVKLLFISQRFEDQLGRVSDEFKTVLFEDEADNNWERIMGDPFDYTPVGSRESLASLIYTSGTTGTPKAVMLTHANLIANLTSIGADLKFTADDIFLSLLPLHHTFESTCGFLTPLTNGSTVVYARSLKSNQILEDISANGITVMIGVPLLWEKLYQAIRRKIGSAPPVKRAMFRTLYSLSAAGWRIKKKWGRSLFADLRQKAGLGSVRLFVSGAAAMPPHISRFFVLLGFDFLQGYGMTETSPVISANRPDDIEFGSVGPPLTGVEVKIDNPGEAGIGEILVRGANCTPGYRDNPEETTALLKDGWLYTGDLGKMRDGHLWITGRAKNLIVSAAGKNIYPEELEEKLLISDYIEEAVVFGRAKDGRQGEEVRATLVPDLEQFKVEFGLDPEHPERDKVMAVLKQTVAEVNEHIAGYKRISGFIMQFEELEKTSTKKIKRFFYH